MPGVVRTLHVAKLNKVHATLDSGVVCIVRVEKIDVVNTTTRRCAGSYDIRLIVALTVHVVKPDDVQTTLGSVAKLDGVHTTHCARSSRRCAYCSRRESRWRICDTQYTFIRHYV